MIDGIKGKEEVDREDRPIGAMIRFLIIYASIISGIVHFMGRGEKKPHQPGVRLDEETMAIVIKEADREDRPSAAMVRILIKEALAMRKKKRK